MRKAKFLPRVAEIAEAPDAEVKRCEYLVNKARYVIRQHGKRASAQ